MDMTFDLLNPASGRKGNAGKPSAVHPSWPELIARMIAAREASVSMARQIKEVADVEHGSFNGGAAAHVAAQMQSRSSVNPNDLGNGKPGTGISSPVAGPSRTGGRGQR
jgi:hypothetical protein